MGPAAGEPLLKGSITNITQRKLTQERLLRELLQDAVTGLPGRTVLLDRLERCCARLERAAHYRCALLIVDLDRFHLVNESLGIDSGDSLLAHVARRLRSSVRSGDTVARLGSDQFVVLVDDLTANDSIEHIARRLQAKISRPFLVNQRPIVLTASVGGVLSTPDSFPKDYLRAADIAVQAAQSNGSGQFRYFSATLQQRVLEAFDLEHSCDRR